MKKAILIGISGCGKTTLIQRLENMQVEYKKTQMVEHYLNFIDTPGEYIERRGMYRALIVTAADAEVIGLVQECGADTTWLPPAFALSFAKPVFGVISKADLAKNERDFEYARGVLREAGVEEIFTVSALEDIGLEPLLEYLSD